MAAIIIAPDAERMRQIPLVGMRCRPPPAVFPNRKLLKRICPAAAGVMGAEAAGDL